MNITLNRQIHATRQGTTLCYLSIPNRPKRTFEEITCPDCLVKEEERTQMITAYIDKLLVAVGEGDSVRGCMWQLVGYVEGGLR